MVADAPPSYDDAIKLNPGELPRTSHTSSLSAEHTIPGTVCTMNVEVPNYNAPPPYAR